MAILDEKINTIEIDPAIIAALVQPKAAQSNDTADTLKLADRRRRIDGDNDDTHRGYTRQNEDRLEGRRGESDGYRYNKMLDWRKNGEPYYDGPGSVHRGSRGDSGGRSELPPCTYTYGGPRNRCR